MGGWGEWVVVVVRGCGGVTFFSHSLDAFNNESVHERTLTVWVVAVRVPPLTLVQPISVVNDADLPKAAVGAGLDDGVAHAAVEQPSGRTHVKT